MTHIIGRGRYGREVYPKPPVFGTGPFLEQAEWYINADTGSDSNDGKTSGTALASWAELARRWGPDPILPQTTDIFIETDLAEDIFVQGTVYLEGQSFLRIFGSVAETLYSGSITAKTDLDAASNQPSEITDAAVGDWDTAGPGGTSLIGHRIRLTSGASAGAVAWLAKRLAATTARTSPFGTQNTAIVPPQFFSFLVDPGVGDSYSVERLTTVQGVRLPVSRIEDNALQTTPSAALLEDVDVLPDNRSSFISGGDKTVMAVRCRIGAFNIVGGTPLFSLCSMSASRMDQLPLCRVLTTLWTDSNAINVNVGARSHVQFERNTLFQAVRVQATAGSHIGTGTEGFAVFDAPGDALSVFETAQVSAQGLIWGDGNTGAGIDVEGTGQVAYASASKPILTGSVGDTVVGDDGVQPYASIPLFNVSDGSAIVVGG